MTAKKTRNCHLRRVTYLTHITKIRYYMVTTVDKKYFDALMFKAPEVRDVIEDFKKDLKKKWSTRKFAKTIPPHPKHLSCTIPDLGNGNVKCYSNPPICTKTDENNDMYGKNTTTENWKLLEPGNDIYAEVAAAQHNTLRDIDTQFKSLKTDPNINYETELKTGLDGKYCRITLKSKDGKPLDNARFKEWYNTMKTSLEASCKYTTTLRNRKNSVTTQVPILKLWEERIYESGRTSCPIGPLRK